MHLEEAEENKGNGSNDKGITNRKHERKKACKQE